MILNYLKTAWRFLTRNPFFTIINIIGLTAGLTAFLMIALFLQHELSYDKHFPLAENTYRLVGIQEPAGLEKQQVAYTSGGWAGFLKDHLPGVEDAFRVMGGSSANFETEEEGFREVYICYSEGKMAHYMGYPIIAGEAELTSANQALISRQTAIRFFGTEQAVGQTIRNLDRLYTITGVFDLDDIRSHLEFNIILSLSTIEPDMPNFGQLSNNSVATYVVLKNSTTVNVVEEAINNHFSEFQQMQSSSGTGMPITFYLQNVRDVYLRSFDLKFQFVHHSGNLNIVYLFSLVGVLMLLIACINFINLATARSTRRAREVGLRKVLGAGRQKLAFQFIGESMLLAFFSLLVALALAELLLPRFNILLGNELAIDFIRNPLFNIGLLLLLLVVGLMAGFYPALYLSKFQPAEVLKSQSGSGQPKKAWLRKTLVIFQFIISTSLIMATLVIMNQVDFMKKKNRGYNPTNVITLPVSPSTSYDRIESFRSYLLSYPEILGVAIASNYNGVAGQQSDIVVADSLQTRLMVRFGFVNPDFFPTMGIEITEGRNFSHESGTDSQQAIMINESTARALGWDQPIGKRFIRPSPEGTDYYTVIGVVKDYHFYSLHNAIQPAVYLYLPGQMPMLVIRYQGGEPGRILARIQADYNDFFPRQFFNSGFLEEILDRQTRSEENVMNIFTWFSILCIVVSCLGLFGLTSFMVNQRRREISLRKIMGASTLKINLMLLGGFFRWIVTAVIIALPITFFAMNRWLEEYPYRIQVGIPHFVFPVMIIMIIAAATILSLSTQAARQNPSENLKYE